MKSSKIKKEQIFAAAKKIAYEQGLKQVNIRRVAQQGQFVLQSSINP